MKALALSVCVAVRQGQADKAQDDFKKILSGAADKAALSELEACLLTAARCRQQELFCRWLQESEPVLRSLASKQELAPACSSLLQALVFAVCDKRLADARQTVGGIVLRFWRSQRGSTAAEALWTELLNLMARMARRTWQEEAVFLLRLLLRELAWHRDVNLWYKRLLQLQMHFVVYARWDGFAKACLVYRDLVYVHLLLLHRAGKVNQSREQGAAWLLLSLRNIRETVANASRSAMQDDMEVFRQWYQFLWQLAGDDEVRKGRLRLLLQLAITYWQRTRPKTSRRQAQFLQDLLQPNLIDKNYQQLLSLIC